MNIESLDWNGYCLVRIKEDLVSDSDLSVLKATVHRHLGEGVKKLALSFSEKSYFFSRTIAVIVQFLGLIKENEGTLAIIHPNEKMLEMIQVVGLDKLIDTYTSEHDLIGQFVRTGNQS